MTFIIIFVMIIIFLFHVISELCGLTDTGIARRRRGSAE